MRLHSRITPWLMMLLAGCSEPSRTQPTTAPTATAEAAREIVAAPALGWGHLTGQFLWNGPAPEIRWMNTGGKDLAACGDRVPDDSILVDAKTGGIANIVVTLRPTKRPIHPDLVAVPKEPVELWSDHCQYVPHIVGLRVGQELVVDSKDAISHNINIKPHGDTGISSLIPTGGRRTERFSRAVAAPVPITCNIHPWERGFVVVRDDPYFAITSADGRFEIKNLPVSEWEFRLWHELTGPLAASSRWPEGRRQLSIRDGETTELNTVAIPAEVFDHKRSR